MTPVATIPLGYSVPHGQRVTIPIGHMAVTGQTQAAGKTTTLEALATRSGRAVLAFVTKRGEGAFGHTAQTVPVYFREHADWRYVEAILESVMRERMKRERSWIMRVSKGAMTLHDVWSNVKEELKTAKGYAADMYMLLDAYLRIVVPQIHELPLTVGGGLAVWQPLAIGPNVMDLQAYSTELQGLIIASCLDYVYQHAEHTIVVIPEAWEFLPNGRKTPVTYAAEAFIRKGGTLKNYLWIDSQDLAGVHTPILKQVRIWLLGVQREINEIKRTLAHLHGIEHKPKPDAIAALGVGQFIACYGSTAVTTYVQPVWVNSGGARRIATGEASPWPAPARIIARRTYVGTGGTQTVPMPLLPPRTSMYITSVPSEDPVDAQLKADNDRLTGENQTLRDRITELETQINVIRSVHESAPPRRAGTTPLHGRPLDDDGKIAFTSPIPGLPTDWLQQVRNKILADATVQAALIKIMTTQPEIVIEVHPRMVTIDGSSPRGRLAGMIANGLLDTGVKPGVIIREFARTGAQIHPSNLSKILDEFVTAGYLTREGTEYQKTAALKITKTELQAV